MPETEGEKAPISNEHLAGETSETIQRVSLVSTSPSVRSIVRVVLIVFVLLAIKDFLEVIVTSLTYLFFMVVLAIFFAYLINPFVDLIQGVFIRIRLGVSAARSAAIAAAFLSVFSVIGLAIYALAPQITEQTRRFVENVPTYTTSVQTTISDLNRRMRRMRMTDAVQTQVNERINTMLADAGQFVTSILGIGAVIAFRYLPWLILVPVLAFFFLKDASLFRAGLLRVVPEGGWRTRVDSLMTDVNETLTAYTRAQLISCVLIGCLCTIGFYLLGHDYALLLGILAGVLELIPLLGPLSVAVIAILLGSLESGWLAVSTAAFLATLRFFQDYVIYPRIIRKGIHLHPLAVILSALAGEQVAGIAGVFIAIPLVALLTVLYKHFQEHSGGLFTGILAPKDNKEAAG